MNCTPRRVSVFPARNTNAESIRQALIMKEYFVCAWPEPVASRAGPVVYAAAEPSEHARVRSEPGRPCTTYIRDEVYTGGSRTHAASCGLGTQFGSRRLCSCAGLHVSRRPLLQCVQLGHVGTHVGHVGHVRAETKLYKQRRDREIPKTLCVRYFTRLYVVSTRGVHARPLKRAAGVYRYVQL